MTVASELGSRLPSCVTTRSVCEYATGSPLLIACSACRWVENWRTSAMRARDVAPVCTKCADVVMLFFTCEGHAGVQGGGGSAVRVQCDTAPSAASRAAESTVPPAFGARGARA